MTEHVAGHDPGLLELQEVARARHHRRGAAGRQPPRDVLEPAGVEAAVEGALQGLGWNGVSGARVGKLIEFDLDDAVADKEAEVKRMCETLLANTVIESYRIEIA